MSTEEEEGRVEKLVKEGEREAQSLEQDAEKLGERIQETRREWEQRRADRVSD
jgi:phage shock protein A